MLQQIFNRKIDSHHSDCLPANKISGFGHYPYLSTDIMCKIDYICLSEANSNLSITGCIMLVSNIAFMAQSFFPASLLDAPQ